MKYIVQIKYLYNRHYENTIIIIKCVCSAPSLLYLYTND